MEPLMTETETFQLKNTSIPLSNKSGILLHKIPSLIPFPVVTEY